MATSAPMNAPRCPPKMKFKIASWLWTTWKGASSGDAWKAGLELAAAAADTGAAPDAGSPLPAVPAPAPPAPPGTELSFTALPSDVAPAESITSTSVTLSPLRGEAMPDDRFIAIVVISATTISVA